MNGDTALFLAAQVGFPDVVKVLVASGKVRGFDVFDANRRNGDYSSGRDELTPPFRHTCSVPLT